MARRTKWVKGVAATILSMSLLATGCGSNSNNDPGSNGQPSGKEGSSNGSKGGITLTLATINNPDMMNLQELKGEWEQKTGNRVEFVVLPENDIRKKITEDVALGAGVFDIVMLGTYDTPIYAQNGWIEPLTPLLDQMSESAKTEYDQQDFFPVLIDALSVDGQLYGLPFAAESSMLYYNKEMIEEAGITVPEHPTWDEVAEMAKTAQDKLGVPGIILRGMPGWGQNLATLNTVINAFGGSWYDMDWNAQLTSPETKEAVEFYVKLSQEAGAPGSINLGFTEGLTLMQSGKAAFYYDNTMAAGFLNDPEQSQVAGKIGYAFAPKQRKDNNGWLWAWNLAIEKASKNKEAALDFITWATSKAYIEKVGKEKGWVVAPAGTRQSLYANPEYQKVADFAQITLDSMLNVDWKNATLKPVPYKGIQYLLIPEFQQLGNEVSQEIAAAIAGNKTVDEALEAAQKLAEQVAVEGGYKK